jgi:hypothetical protein
VSWLGTDSSCTGLVREDNSQVVSLHSQLAVEWSSRPAADLIPMEACKT